MVIGWFCFCGSAMGITSLINLGCLAMLDFLLVFPLLVALLVPGLCRCVEAVSLSLIFWFCLLVLESLLVVLGPALVVSFYWLFWEIVPRSSLPLTSWRIRAVLLVFVGSFVWSGSVFFLSSVYFWKWLCFSVLFGQSQLLSSLSMAVQWCWPALITCAGESGCTPRSSLHAFWERKRQVTLGVTYNIWQLVASSTVRFGTTASSSSICALLASISLLVVFAYVVPWDFHLCLVGSVFLYGHPLFTRFSISRMLIFFTIVFSQIFLYSGLSL